MMGELDLPQDCFGDDLYNHMVEMGWLDSLENYEMSGDSHSVAVMSKAGKKPDFYWRYGAK